MSKAQAEGSSSRLKLVTQIQVSSSKLNNQSQNLSSKFKLKMKAQGLISGLKPYGIVENQHLKLKIKNQVKGSS